MDRSPAAVWSCLLGAGLALAFLPAFSVTASEADPRPPRLTGCVFQNRANVTCRWEAGDAAATNFTLHVHLVFKVCNRPQTSVSADDRASSLQLHNSSFRSAKAFSCSTSGLSCTAQLAGTSVRNCFCVTVTADEANGSVTSRPRCQRGRTEVMLPPVLLDRVHPVGERPRCLKVSWSRVLALFPLAASEIKAGDLGSQIEFTEQGQLGVQVETVTVTDQSFVVCLFRPDRCYSVRLRLRYRGPASPWSRWSDAREGRTGEGAPCEAPAFWRRVKQTDEDAGRLTTLLWKPLPRLLANGRVLFFNVTCRTEGGHRVFLSDRTGCRDLHPASTSCSVLLPAAPCSCALTASTAAGRSPEARVWLSGASETEPPPPSHFSVAPLHDGVLDVRWTPPAHWSPSGFVVEWFAVREKNSGLLYWETLNSSCAAQIITEGVKPMERYAVSVKGLYGEKGAGPNRTLLIYTQQGAPSAGPKVVVQQISGSRVELRWSPVPVELLRGFIRNYTIFYTTANHMARVVVPGGALRFSRYLTPGDYDIFMRANTDAGAGAAGPIANVHIGSEEVSIVVYAFLPLSLTSVLLLLLGCLAQNKMYDLHLAPMASLTKQHKNISSKVKQKLCRGIPDPSHSSMAHWTPKIPLERSAFGERTEIKYSEVILLGGREPQNIDPDLHLSRGSDLQTCSSQTPQNSRTSEKRCIESSYSPCAYATVLFSQALKGPSSFHCQQSPVSDVELQLGGDSGLHI